MSIADRNRRLHFTAKAIIIVAWVLFAASLCLPVFHHGDDFMVGVAVLILGVIGLSFGYVGWLGNVGLVVMTNQLWKQRNDWASFNGLISIILACTTFWIQKLPGNGGDWTISELGVGFYLWFSAIALISLGAIAVFAFSDQPRHRPKVD